MQYICYVVQKPEGRLPLDWDPKVMVPHHCLDRKGFQPIVEQSTMKKFGDPFRLVLDAFPEFAGIDHCEERHQVVEPANARRIQY